MNSAQHDVATAAWENIKRDLVERGMINLSHFTEAAMEALDITMGAHIDGALEEAAKLDRPNEDIVVCKVDATKLNINKPDDGHRILVDSSSFSLTDGHLKIQPGQEMAIRFHQGQVLIVVRPIEVRS